MSVCLLLATSANNPQILTTFSANDSQVLYLTLPPAALLVLPQPGLAMSSEF